MEDWGKFLAPLSDHIRIGEDGKPEWTSAGKLAGIVARAAQQKGWLPPGYVGNESYPTFLRKHLGCNKKKGVNAFRGSTPKVQGYAEPILRTYGLAEEEIKKLLLS